MQTNVHPSDDLLHPLGPEPDFMETNYYNVFDQASGVGGFFRLGNRPNEGWAEMTVCVFLPDGTLAFMFGRPPVSTNDAFDAGGMRFDVVKPFEEQRIRYEGQVALFDDARALLDPKRAFTAAPHGECRADLRVTGMCEPWQPPEVQGWGGEGTGHNEQLTAVAGSITVGSRTFDIDGYGIRDHSWGARTWHKVCRVGRWLTAPLGREFAFMGFYMAEEGAPAIDRGFVWDGERLHFCDRFEIESTEYDEEYFQRAIVARLGAGDREWVVHGEVLRVVPLRHRKEGWVTRICEGLTRWSVVGGPTGWGLSEYMDQMEDAVPAGVAQQQIRD